jgi:DNA-directed RNA polymerase beta subunit
MVREDVLTSVHVDEYSLDVRETKRGMEVFTNDIPTSVKRLPKTSTIMVSFVWVPA